MSDSIRHSPAQGRSGPTRRGLLQAGGVGLVAASAVGCDMLSTDPGGQKKDAGGSGGSRSRKNPKQAPMLDAKVKSGELPQLANRLPDKPLVIKPTDSIGKYGGTWHSWFQGLAATYIFDDEVGYDYLVRWDPKWEKVIPNLAESYDVGKDGRTYTFHLRTGMRWSDGKPFTADDLVFAYEDVLKNSVLYPVHPSQFVIEDKMARLEKLDDHTVRFVFHHASGLFLERLSTPAQIMIKPRHYLKDFLPKYNKDLDKVAKDQGYSEWTDLFWAKDDAWRNTDLPVLNAWQVVDGLGKNGGRATFERNPYYWKTDSAGSQLPYLDRVAYRMIHEIDVATLKTSSGEIDFNHPTFTGGVCTSVNKPVLARSRKKGGYHFVDGKLSTMNQMIIAFNLTHKDPVLRKVFQNKDFRIGMSHALNRQEIANVVFQRQGEPWQAAPRKDSDVFHEKLAKQYTEFDVDEANRRLDAAGLTERDGAGFRRRPDGKRLAFSVEVVTEEPEEINALELVHQYWKKVGVDSRSKVEDRTLFYERKDWTANSIDASVWTGDGGWGGVMLEARWYLPFSSESNWATPWAAWYGSDGKDGEKPPAPAREQMKLYDQVKATTDKAEQRKLYGQILDIAQEQFWVLGTVMSPGTYGTVKDTFHNVPDWIPGAWLYPSPGPTRPEQYWTES